MATTICLDFLMFPDNTPMPTPFTLASFNFSKVGAGMDCFVNVSGGDKGLQFPDQGIKIKLPAPSTKISLKIGQFSQPIKISLVSAAGVLVGSAVINAPNKYTTKNFLLRGKADSVVLTGGNNEGILAKICATI